MSLPQPEHYWVCCSRLCHAWTFHLSTRCFILLYQSFWAAWMLRSLSTAAHSLIRTVRDPEKGWQNGKIMFVGVRRIAWMYLSGPSLKYLQLSWVPPYSLDIFQSKEFGLIVTGTMSFNQESYSISSVKRRAGSAHFVPVTWKWGAAGHSVASPPCSALSAMPTVVFMYPFLWGTFQDTKTGEF